MGPGLLMRTARANRAINGPKTTSAKLATAMSMARNQSPGCRLTGFGRSGSSRAECNPFR